MGTEVQSNSSPGVEVSSGVYSAAGSLALTDGPVLLKGLGALNGRSVGSSANVDVVGSAVAGDGALPRSTGRGVVSSCGVNW